MPQYILEARLWRDVVRDVVAMGAEGVGWRDVSGRPGGRKLSGSTPSCISMGGIWHTELT